MLTLTQSYINAANPKPEQKLYKLFDRRYEYLAYSFQSQIRNSRAALVPGLPAVCGASRCWRGGAAKAWSAILPVLPSRLMIHHSLLLGTSVHRSWRSRDRRMASMLQTAKHRQKVPVPQPMWAQKPVATQHAQVVKVRLLECSDHYSGRRILVLSRRVLSTRCAVLFELLAADARKRSRCEFERLDQ
jgi:hypothetical protein